MKKRHLAILILILTMASMFILAACSKKDKITFVDFPAEKQETVELGSVYSLLSAVKDEEGNEYRLSVSVKTKDGVDVPYFDHKFDVTDISGYIITYTAVIGNDTSHKSVVKLSVNDNTEPNILINKPADGVVNELYTLPHISASDLAGSKITLDVQVYLVSGDTRTPQSVTENEGVYSFTPIQTGNYEISVTASKANGKSKTVTRMFVVNTSVAEGEVFSPDVTDPAAQIAYKAAGGVATDKIITKKGDSNEGNYIGTYISIDGSQIGDNKWVDIHLTPRQSLEVYNDYDIVEIWVYFVTTSENVKVGLLGGSTAATDPLLREFPGNEWAKLSISADTFFEKIDTTRLLSVNFNNAASGNHAGVTEIRLGTVMAKYSFDPKVEIQAESVNVGEESEVKLSVDTQVSFTAEIYDSEGQKVESAVSGNVVTARLSIGNYTYKIVSSDEMFIGSVQGSFSVESKTQIALPETISGVAGEEFIIPEASVFIDGADSGVKADFTSEFVQGIGGANSVVDGDTFVPMTGGTLKVTYSYEGAVNKIQEFTIEPAQVLGNLVYDAITATAQNTVSNNGKQKFEVKAGDSAAMYKGDYIEITAPDYTGWTNTRLTLGVTADSFKEYDLIELWVYFEAQNTVTHSLFNDNVYKQQYTANEWHKITVERAQFISKMSGENKDLLALNFNIPENANFPGLTAVRLGGIVARYAFDSAEVSAPSANVGENATVTITVNEGTENYTFMISKDGSPVTENITKQGNVITALLPVGNYTYEIESADEMYVGTIEGSFSVESKTQIVLPEVISGVAGEEFTIPQASIFVDGEDSGKKADFTAKFVPNYGNGTVDGIIESVFTPTSSGVLTVFYTYEGAADKSIEITIGKAENTTGKLLDLRNADVLGNLSTNDSLTSVDYDAENKYIIWTGEGNWKQLKIDFDTTNATLAEGGYSYVKVQVFYKTDGATGNVTGWFCGGGLKVGTIDTPEGKLRQIPHDTWYTVYIPVSNLTDDILQGTKDFLQAGFGLADGGHFPKVQNIYLKGFEPVAEPDEKTEFLDMSDSSVINQFTKPSGTFEYAEQTEEERAFISWKGAGTWQSLYMKALATCNAESTYNYIAVELYYVSTDPGDVDVSGYFLHGNYKIGDGNNGADIGLKANQWVTVYLPVSTFYSSNAAAGTGYLLQCSFNVSGNGHFPGITEIRIGNTYFTNNNVEV